MRTLSATSAALFERDEGGGGGWTCVGDAALRELRRRFRTWVGRSSRRYVVSTFAADACPDFEDGLILLVRSGRVVGSLDGAAGFAVAAVAAELSAEEAHVHLLAPDAASRAAVARDLVGL